MLLPPGEDPTLAIAAAHQPFHLLAIQTLRPRAIPNTIAVFEVNAVLVKEVKTLLFIVYLPLQGQLGTRRQL